MNTPSHFRRRLASLLEISNEMSLNADDGAFCRPKPAGSDGRIYYVFDQTAFQFFVAPDRVRRKYSALFHLAEWRDEGMDPEAYWILVNEMHAVQTAEYLFSGNLPGQGGHPILMTAQHRQQVGLSYRAIVGRCIERYRAPGAAHSRRVALRELERLSSGGPKADLRLDEDRLAFDGDQRTNFDRARAISVAFAKRQEDFLPDQLHRFAEGIWPRITELSQIFPLTEGDRAEIAEATDSWISRLEAASRAFDPERPTGFREDAEAIAAIQHIARHLLDKDERIVFVTGDWSVLSAYWQWYGEVYTTTPWEPVVVRTIKSFAPLLNLSQLLKGDSASENDRVPFTRIQVAANLALHPFNMRVDAEHRLDDPQVGGLWWFRQKLLENIDRNNIFDDPLFGSIDEDMLATEVEDEFRAVRDIFQSLERRASLAALHYLEERRESVLRRTPELANSPDETATVAQFANEAELLLRRSITIWHSLVTQSIRDRIAEASAADNILRTPVNISLRIPLSGGGRELQNLAEVEKSLANLDPAELERPEILAHLIFAIGSISAIRLRRFSLAVQYAELAKDAFRTTFADGPAAARGHPDYQELRYLNAVTLRLQLGSGGSHEFLKAPPPQQTDLMRKRRQAAERDIEGCIAYHLAEGHPLRLARAYMERASIKLFIAVRESARVRGTRSYDRESHHRFFEAVYDLARSFGVISTTAVSEEDQDRRDLRQGLNAHLMATVAAVDCFLVRLPYMQDDRFALEARLHDASAAAAQYLPTADPRSYPVVVRREVVDFLSRRGIEAPAGWRSRKGVSIAIDAEIVHLMNLPVVDLL